MEINPLQSFGLQEINSCKEFNQGNLVVDQDETVLFFMKAKKLVNLLTEKQLKQLVEDPAINVKYPDEDDIKVKIDASEKVKRLRS